jgi:hypothetical protein
VPEYEILFVGGEWYSQYGWVAYVRPLEDLRLLKERVLDFGPDPPRDELVSALELTCIEREASFHGVSFGTERYDGCTECGHSTMLTFDRRCRMCYDGEWTDRLTATIAALARSVRKRNGSFVHQIEREVDPLHPTDRAMPEQILWRKRPVEGVPKIVVVEQRLQDDSDGHYEYILVDPVESGEWRYHEDDLAATFYNTGLMVGHWYNAVDDERLRELYEGVSE